MADIFDNLTPGVYYSDIPKKHTGGIISRFVRESIASQKKFIITIPEETVSMGNVGTFYMPVLIPSGLSLEELIGSEVRWEEQVGDDYYYYVNHIVDVEGGGDPAYLACSRSTSYIYFPETGLFGLESTFTNYKPAGMTVEEFGQKLYEYLTMNPEDAPEMLEIWVDATEDTTTGAMSINARFSVSADDILSDKPAVAKIHFTSNNEVRTNAAIDTVDASGSPFYIPVLEPVGGQTSSVGLQFHAGDDGTVDGLNFLFGSASRALLPSDASRTIWAYTSEDGSGEN